MGRRAAFVVTLLALASAGGALAGCSDDKPTREPPEPAWHEVRLPSPPGPAGRLALRDATSCPGAWYIVGAMVGPDGSTRPAAWTSDDARTWRSVPTAPAAFWARQAVLSSVACRGDQVAAIGAKPGGAHGNPRTSSWRLDDEGALVDVPAPFELYGGPEAVSVNRIADGPDGWLIAGTRTSGAAVWVSPDATGFRLVDDDPALSTDPEHVTAALDPVHDGTAWTVVGRVHRPGRVPPAPMAWTSADGAIWQREDVPAGTDGYADLQRVIGTGDRIVVGVGVRGDRFGTWERRGGRWRPEAAFGALAGSRTRAPVVTGLAATEQGLLATVGDGARFGLWAQASDGDWRGVRIPTRTAHTGDTVLAVAAAGSTVLLVSDDGSSGRVWVATWDDISG